ncbi:MFS transporter [Budviciaceae bacterium BWR-B9]|uniref:MFS transporter n=1 Tax=Limnobaculum allomyrinae TaxID=2791986 RepID=A0ABS1IVC2_9GAMM|nr:MULTISPECIES: MFS transporter [Limnobaculum]MBK5145689.1 MFS transporter [Limnobaculum allomyrinae]MBV7693777.1 MFS transporter [Limnobaculum sp. M2-1]
MTNSSSTITSKKNTKWHVLFGGFFGYMFDAVDILLLAVSMPVIIADLGISKADGGLLATSTMVGIGLSSIVVGWCADNYGRRKTLFWSLMLFSILTAAIAFTSTWFEILVLRFLAGLGLGGVWSIIVAYISETWPAKQRGRAASFVLSSFPVGAGLAAFLSYLIIPDYGWRALFLCGAGAIIAAVYFLIFVPESETWKKEKESRKNKSERVSISEIFSPELARNTVLATIVASFGLIGYWGCTTWLPLFLTQDRGLSLENMSLFFVVLNVGMFVGYNVFGVVADKVGRRTALIWSFIGTAITLPIYVSMTGEMALLIMGPVYAFFTAFVGLMGSYFPELFPTRVRTIGAGFCFNIGRGVSAFAPFAMGFIAQSYGLVTGIMICAVFFCLAGFMMFALPNIDGKKQPTAAQSNLEAQEGN